MSLLIHGIVGDCATPTTPSNKRHVHVLIVSVRNRETSQQRMRWNRKGQKEEDAQDGTVASRDYFFYLFILLTFSFCIFLMVKG